jgi:hypothetical protein
MPKFTYQIYLYKYKNLHNNVSIFCRNGSGFLRQNDGSNTILAVYRDKIQNLKEL